jgi:hypothetical protein
MVAFPRFLSNIFSGVRAMRGLSPAPGQQDGLTPQMNPVHQWFYRQIELGRDRFAKYREYETMDEQSVILSTALNYYADDATQFDRAKGSTVWVESESPEIEAILMELYQDRLEIEDNVWLIHREIAKFGDHPRRLMIDMPEASEEDPYFNSRGITGWYSILPWKFLRLENPKGELIGFKLDERSAGYASRTAVAKDPRKNPQDFYNPWDFIHFRLMGGDSDDEWRLYGTSMLKSSRAVYRRLGLLEEALAIYRLMKGATRYIFYVDVTGLPHTQAIQTIMEYKRRFRRKQYLNPDAGQYSQPINPMSVEDDLYWGIRQGANSRIDMIQGSADVSNIADLEYFRDLESLATGIPREYLSGEGGAVLQIGGQSLAQKDIRYARLVKRLQRAGITGLTRVGQIHLALLNIDPSPDRFKVRMSTVSNLDEQQKLEALSAAVAAASQMVALLRDIEVNPDVLKTYVVRELLGLSGSLADQLLLLPAPLPPDEPPLGGKEVPTDPNAPPAPPTSAGGQTEPVPGSAYSEAVELLRKNPKLSETMKDISQKYSQMPDIGNVTPAGPLPRKTDRTRWASIPVEDLQEATSYQPGFPENQRDSDPMPDPEGE